MGVSASTSPLLAGSKALICIAGCKKSPDVAVAVDLAKLSKAKHNDEYELWSLFGYSSCRCIRGVNVVHDGDHSKEHTARKP
eukprot:3294523-Pleurochrysis_carterae.AAC.1